MQIRVRTHQGGDNRLTIAFTQATETQSRPPAKILFLSASSVKADFARFVETGVACECAARPRVAGHTARKEHRQDHGAPHSGAKETPDRRG